MILKEWRLESTTGEPITLTFAAFDTTDYSWYSDIVEITDGSSTQTFSGTSVPGPVTATTITVKFSSGHRDTSKGFLATVCCSASITTDVPGE